MTTDTSERGTIDVLRHGLKHGPLHIDLFYGTPSPGNAKAAERCDANIPWSDADRMHKLITDEIPSRVSADKALARVMAAALKDDAELFKQFMDNESFKRWLADTVFELTYERPQPNA